MSGLTLNSCTGLQLDGGSVDISTLVINSATSDYLISDNHTGTISSLTLDLDSNFSNKKLINLGSTSSTSTTFSGEIILKTSNNNVELNENLVIFDVTNYDTAETFPDVKFDNSTKFNLGTVISNSTAISELQNQLNVMFNSTFRTTAKNAASSALYREVDLSSLTDGARDNVNTQINTVFSEGKITEHQANTFKINMGLATTTSETFSGTPTEYKIFSNVTFEGTVNCNGFKFTRDTNANSNCNITLKGDSKLFTSGVLESCGTLILDTLDDTNSISLTNNNSPSNGLKINGSNVNITTVTINSANNDYLLSDDHTGKISSNNI